MDEIVNQIEKRAEETGRVVSHHKNLSKEQLKRVVEEDINQKENLINLLEQFDVPVLKINTRNDLTHNLTQIKNFIGE